MPSTWLRSEKHQFYKPLFWLHHGFEPRISRTRDPCSTNSATMPGQRKWKGQCLRGFYGRPDGLGSWTLCQTPGFLTPWRLRGQLLWLHRPVLHPVEVLAKWTGPPLKPLLYPAPYAGWPSAHEGWSSTHGGVKRLGAAMVFRTVFSMINLSISMKAVMSLISGVNSPRHGIQRLGQSAWHSYQFLSHSAGDDR